MNIFEFQRVKTFTGDTTNRQKMFYKIRYFSLFFLLIAYLHAGNIGQKVSDFELPLLEDASLVYSSSKLNNRIILINFWASWCQSCKAEMPHLNKLAKVYKKYPFKVVAINLDRKKEIALKFVAKFKEDIGTDLDMTMLYDKDKMLFKKHPAQGYPYTLLVKDGIIIDDFLGSFDEKSIKVLSDRIGKFFN